MESLVILRGPSQAQDHHLGLSLLIDVNVYEEPVEGVVASSEKYKLKQHEYKGTQQDLHQILHTCTLSRRVGGVIAASQL